MRPPAEKTETESLAENIAIGLCVAVCPAHVPRRVYRALGRFDARLPRPVRGVRLNLPGAKRFNAGRQIVNIVMSHSPQGRLHIDIRHSFTV